MTKKNIRQDRKTKVKLNCFVVQRICLSKTILVRDTVTHQDGMTTYCCTYLKVQCVWLYDHLCIGNKVCTHSTIGAVLVSYP